MKQLTNFKWLNLFEKDGWIWSSRKKLEEQQKPKCDAVIIVPVFADGRICLISEYRIPLGCEEYTFPAGLVENDEDFTETVRRELKEETGLDLVRIDHVSPLLASSAGLTDECVKIVYCLVSGKPTNEGNVGGEKINIHIFNIAQIRTLVKKPNTVFSSKCYPILNGALINIDLLNYYYSFTESEYS